MIAGANWDASTAEHALRMACDDILPDAPIRLHQEVQDMSIHQEALIEAAREQVYEVLTDGEKFAAATGQPAHLTDHEGETFSLFGGWVEGRQIELVSGERSSRRGGSAQRILRSGTRGSTRSFASPWPRRQGPRGS